MLVLKDGGEGIEESPKDTAVFFDDPHYIHFVGMIGPPRPGVMESFQALEHTHYKPLTPRNDLYHFRVLDFEEILFGIVSIPITEKNLMEAVAEAHGLRIVRDTVAIISGNGMKPFPIQNDRMYMLVTARDNPPTSKFPRG